MRTSPSPVIALAIFLAALNCLARPVEAQFDRRLDLALVLAVDTSTSVDNAEYRLQMLGLANAFRHESVRQAVRTGAPLGMAVTLMQWSGKGEQAQVIPWTVLRRDEDIEQLAQRIADAERQVRGGRTALGEAVTESLKLFDSLDFDVRRRVIDVSGDGGSNDGILPREAREMARAAYVTVNGVAILNEEPRLDIYYRSDLIVGPGSFLITATNYVDFARAIRLKLVREIIGNPMALLDIDPDRERVLQ
ncbi:MULTISPECIES: DUF1194 domain-containing protein [unclassified Minwuia]|jgi:Protein of unknown function (DUF1194)|uniref:DUF1194 domain-containing protein n=1 Tax=unclassified Minwuia TaxID=2618799 RepID=UPI002479D2C4|nr:MULTISPECIES: DUF1194 domain-containing protein [unclassified Minwuia]